MLAISVPIQLAHVFQGFISTYTMSSTLLSSLYDPTICSAMVSIASSMDAPFLWAGAPDVPVLVAVDLWVDWLVGWSVDWLAGWSVDWMQAGQ